MGSASAGRQERNTYMTKDKNKRINIVYSTDPEYHYELSGETEQQTLPPAQQDLRVMLDKKQRAGKAVTLITGFIGNTTDLEQLGKQLKVYCGTGGSVKDGEIILQGDSREKVMGWLAGKGYRAKKAGG